MKKFLLTIAVLVATQVASAASVEVTNSKGQLALKCDNNLSVVADSAANSEDVITIKGCGKDVTVPTPTLNGASMDSDGIILLMNQPNVLLQCQAADVRNAPSTYFRCERIVVTYRLKAPTATVKATNSKGQSAECPIDLATIDSAANSGDVVTMSVCAGNNVVVPAPVLNTLKMDSARLVLLMSQPNVQLQCQAVDVLHAPSNYFRCGSLKVVNRLGR